MRNDVTDTAWAARWLSASGVAVQNGEVIRSWGKDEHGHLVAVRTDSGTYPVRNLSAVLAHDRKARAEAGTGYAQDELHEDGERIAWDREEADYCERGTFGCSKVHTRDSECATW